MKDALIVAACAVGIPAGVAVVSAYGAGLLYLLTWTGFLP